MRKMGGPYTGTGHATLLAAMCGALTSHGTTLPALGLTPGHKESPGEQVGLGQLIHLLLSGYLNLSSRLLPSRALMGERT